MKTEEWEQYSCYPRTKHHYSFPTIDAQSVNSNEANADLACTDISMVEKEAAAFIRAVDQLYGKMAAARAVALWLQDFDSLPLSGAVPWRATIEAASRLAYDSVMDDHDSRGAMIHEPA